MSLFSKKSRSNDGGGKSVQTSRRIGHPFYALDRYSPLGDPEIKIYESIREALPVVDAAICKIVRLIGGFDVQCPDKSVGRQINRFLGSVKVGPTLYGIENFLSVFTDQLIMYGTSAGEMIIDGDGQLAALYNTNIKDIELKTGSSPMDAVVLADSGRGFEPVKRPDLILLSALNPLPGQVRGNSILKGLPFVSSILMKIFNTIGVNWERVGNLRFAITYRPESNSLGTISAAEHVDEIAKAWSSAMSDEGEVRDFVGVGDIDIKVIGADNQILDSSVPVRQLLEQIVAKTGLPPFMLGFSWSTTEKMSSQQADILTSELESYRRLLTPVIRRIVERYLYGIGSECDFDICWHDINLQDETELAKAALLRAQAKQIEVKLGGTEA